MGTLILLRHGRAALGTANYDELSELGRRQVVLAGARLRRRGDAIGQVVSGALARQRDTAATALAALGRQADDVTIDARLDEYDHIDVLGGDSFRAATDPQAARALQEHLDAAIARWIAGDGSYAEPHAQFVDRVSAVVAELAAGSGVTLAATSAGVIGLVCARVWRLPADRWPMLARITVNAALTTVVSGPAGLRIESFNDHAHLEHDRSLVTYR